jgi:hypothetical protein
LTKKRPKKAQFTENDVYGLSKHEMEVDTDVNEDANRERLLDESLASFLDSLEKK